MVLASVAAMAQGRVIGAFPYAQPFSFVTSATTAFPTTNVDGGEFTADAGTSSTFVTSLASHGISNNGGGSIRLQSTVASGAAGIVWYGNFTGRTAGTLAIDWSKVQNPATSTQTNELRIATNGGSGSTFTDIASVTWPQFDNSTTAQSGTLTVTLPASLDNSSDVRIRIYSVNVSGSGNQPRVALDNLRITACGTITGAPTITSVTATNTSRVEIGVTGGSFNDSLLIVRRAGSAPTFSPTTGTVYTLVQGLNGTDTVAFSGAVTGGVVSIEGLQAGTTYYFAVYGKQSCGGTYSLAAATSVTTLTCGGAPGQITGVVDVARTQTSVTLDYNRSIRTDSVLVIRRLRAAPSVGPTSGVRYTTGQGLNSVDTVGYFGPATDLIAITGLRPDSLYYFAVYGFQSCNGLYSSPAGIDSARTYCTGSVSGVTDLQLLYTTATSAGLSVTAPSDVQYVVIFSRGPDTTKPAPVNGTLYTAGQVVGDDTVRYVGTARRPIVLGLNPSSTYRFYALGLLACNYAYSSSGDSVNATTLATCSATTPGVIDSLTVTRNVVDTLRLRWRAASGANRYLVVARIDSTPTVAPSSGTWYAVGDSLGRATILANSSDTSVAITGIARNTALFIKVYAFTNCQLTYGSASPLFTTATKGTDSSQRFALRAGRLDTISFGGATIEFAQPPSSDGSVLITRRTGHPGTLGIPMQRNGEPVVDAVSADRWWQLTRNGLGDFDVRLLFDVTNLPGMQDINDLEIIYRPTTTSSWTDIRTEGWDSANGRMWLYSNVQPFVGEYAIGANSAHNVLPVKLTSFEGFSEGRRNVLRWSTASELNTAGYRLSRAIAGSSAFATVADHTSDPAMIGAGTTNAEQRYRHVDDDAALVPGTRYVYRLEEIALDGAVTEIGRVAVEMRATTGMSMATIAPTPTGAAAMATLRFPVAVEGPIAVRLVDLVGATVRTIVDEPSAASGERTLVFSVEGLAAGTYFCQITSAAGRTVVPITITR
jgi:hypothetical protein